MTVVELPQPTSPEEASEVLASLRDEEVTATVRDIADPALRAQEAQVVVADFDAELTVS